MKKTYDVRIEEILTKVISVDAETEDEAVDIIKYKYRHQQIILDAEDFCCVDFSAEEVI